MPNWCWNSMTITGEPSEIERFLSGAKVDAGGDHSFLDAYYPCPEELMNQSSPSPNAEEMTEKYGYSDWYDWCCEKWGTKWPECEMCIKHDEGSTTASLGYDTAWAPAIAGYAEISLQFPSLVFDLYYEEPGCGFCGDARIKDGAVEDDCRDYVDEDDEEGNDIFYPLPSSEGA
jgi:hypothetical protein